MTDENKDGNQPNGNVSFSLDDLKAAMSAEFDNRFSGFQSLLDRRTSELRKELDDLKTADLTPEEQEQVRSREANERLARLERENEILRMRKDYPEEVDLLEEFFKKSSLDDQLALLANFRKAKEEAATPEGGADNQPTPVDKNSPPRRGELTVSDIGDGKMNSELADKVLEQVGQEKGFLRRLRGG
jgi:hypothetical protein